MSAKHHSYLRTKRELIFKAQGLQLDLRLRRGYLPEDHHSCRAALWRQPHVQPRAVQEAEGLATDSMPKPQAFLPTQPGWMKEMDKECATPVLPSNPWGSTNWPGSASVVLRHSALVLSDRRQQTASSCRAYNSEQITGCTRCKRGSSVSWH